MSGEGVEVYMQAITGEDWEAARSQHVSQGVNEQMRRVLRSRAQMEHGKNLRERVNGEPKPQHLCGAPKPGAQFVEAAGAAGGDDGSSVRARSVHVPQRESTR